MRPAGSVGFCARNKRVKGRRSTKCCSPCFLRRSQTQTRWNLLHLAPARPIQSVVKRTPPAFHFTTVSDLQQPTRRDLILVPWRFREVKMMQEVSVTVSCDAQLAEQMSEEEILACLVAETGPHFLIPTKKAKRRESRLQLMDEKEEEEEEEEEDPLNKCQMENRRLQQASLRLEQENDNLAHRLITSKVALRSALDKAEDSVEMLTSDLTLTRRQLQATEEEKQGKEEEAAMLKEVLRRELESAEQEVKRSSGIIADYKQICTQLTTRLERQQDAHLQEVHSLKSAMKACAHCRHHAAEYEEGEASDASPSPPHDHSAVVVPEWDQQHSGPTQAELRRENQERASLKAQIRQLEKELAQTKLQVVEANCKIQELEHERGILANNLQDAKNNWISKAFTSLRTSTDGGPSAGGRGLHGASLSGWKLSWPHKDNREHV
ncbi:rab GTPase-activating protein 1-like isoform X2 [Vanacampus margaritifer]